MKKIIALILIIVLAITLLTSCGGKSDSKTSTASSAPKTSNSANSSTAPANSSAPPASSDNGGNTTPASKTPRGIRTPDVTVNPGDVIFDNEYIELIYDKFDSALMYINCTPYGNSTRDLYVYENAEPLVINGIATDFVDDGLTNMRSSREGGKIGASEVPIMLETRHESALKQAGVAVEDLKTVQVTITLKSMDTEEVLFEITVLFNIE